MDDFRSGVITTQPSSKVGIGRVYRIIMRNLQVSETLWLPNEMLRG